MTYEQRDNTGSLFRNEQKKHENGPDYSGKCMIDGKMYFFDAWLKKPPGKKPYQSFSFKAMDAATPNDTRTHAERKKPTFSEMDDDIPFN